MALPPCQQYSTFAAKCLEFLFSLSALQNLSFCNIFLTKIKKKKKTKTKYIFKKIIQKK